MNRPGRSIGWTSNRYLPICDISLSPVSYTLLFCPLELSASRRGMCRATLLLIALFLLLTFRDLLFPLFQALLGPDLLEVDREFGK